MLQANRVELAGVWISLTEEEQTKIFALCEDSGLSPDGAGVRGLLLAAVNEEGEAPERSPILDYIVSNPAKVEAVVSELGNLAGTILGRIRQRKNPT